MHEKIEELANKELETALASLPSDVFQRFALFVEITRVLDYSRVFQASLESPDCSRPDLDLLLWGWNLATGHLVTPVRSRGIPIAQSIQETRQFAISLLHKFGQSVLLRRAAAMVRAGFLTVHMSPSGGVNLRMAAGAKEQFLDNLEFDRLLRIENELNRQDTKFHKGWQLFEIEDLATLEHAPGFFLGRAGQDPLAKYKSEKIDELMRPLIHPWDSGRGMMMGYGALPEVDDHFLATSMQFVSHARDEAGLHPEADLGSITGGDLTAIIAFVTALHMKHVRFSVLAMKEFPEICIPQALTIWGPLAELEDSIVDYSQLDRTQVRNALDAITLRPEEASRLSQITYPIVPLLLGVGNGMILRPVSSIARNPFICARTLFEWRNPHITHRVSQPRESWLRSQVYALFQGSRYRLVQGNVKLRNDGRVVTDIDAAIFDIVTGELALFQLKWQDYFTNDVRELRSKARNLTNELDHWAGEVEKWIQLKGTAELTAALRLKLKHGESIVKIFLFGLSRTYARMHGFGFPITSEKLAIANWPQFQRNRYEMGPAQPVFSRMFQSLRTETDVIVESTPIPFTIRAGETSICFEDLWHSFGED